MKAILNRLYNQEVLTKEEAKTILVNISKGDYNEAQVASFMTVYMMRSISIEELSGFRDALLELCIPVDFSGYNTLDLCGTGGDGKDTFNISTLASFVVAGAGYKVAKHGNYGVSSVSGSSHVMECLGIKFSFDEQWLKRCLDTCNIAFLHAPLFHPAMKNVGSIRKALGVKTFFNMLGPMVNPSFPKHQLIGVFSLELARMYAYLYQNTPIKFKILHGLAGFDEISLTDDVKIISNKQELLLSAQDFLVPQVAMSDLKGGVTPKDSAQLFYNIISGNGTTPQNHVVCVNAAVAIQTISNKPYEEALQMAQESLYSKKALAQLNEIINLSKA